MQLNNNDDGESDASKTIFDTGYHVSRVFIDQHRRGWNRSHGKEQFVSAFTADVIWNARRRHFNLNRRQTMIEKLNPWVILVLDALSVQKSWKAFSVQKCSVSWIMGVGIKVQLAFFQNQWQHLKYEFFLLNITFYNFFFQFERYDK